MALDVSERGVLADVEEGGCDGKEYRRDSVFVRRVVPLESDDLLAGSVQ